MPLQNEYLAYKRDTRYLTYWIIHASNAIAKRTPDQDQATLNHTGQVTISDMLSLVKRIAERARSIPDTIYRLFRSVIDARSKVHSVFKQATEKSPDANVEKSNVGHKHFIDVLEEAFKVLGGETWSTKQNERQKTSGDESLDEVIFANAFATLDLGEDVDEESDNDSDENMAPTTQQRQQKKGNGKGKRKRKKTKTKARPAGQEQKLEDIPFESYRIIDDTEGIVTDYLLAVYSLLDEAMRLRTVVQESWRDVAYYKLNSATAGALSNFSRNLCRLSRPRIVRNGAQNHHAWRHWVGENEFWIRVVFCADWYYGFHKSQHKLRRY